MDHCCKNCRYACELLHTCSCHNSLEIFFLLVYLCSSRGSSFLFLNYQSVWDEVGESEEDRDKVLFQLDQECLDVYKRKVDQATKSRDLLLQALDYSKTELARLASALGEKSIDISVRKYARLLPVRIG